jgi:CubicO group peptidase (beta-lactamase class C family)
MRPFPIGFSRRLSLAASFLVAATLTAQVVAAQELPTASPESVGMSSERLGRVTAALESYVGEGRLPGAVAMVLRDGKVVYTGVAGARDIEGDLPMTSDAIFRIASQTKALVSVGIMMLQEEGALLISDPVSRYLPAFAHTTVAQPRDDGGYDVVDAERAITLRDLLTHTAGIAYGGGPGGDRWQQAEITGWYFAHRDEPVRATIDRLASLPFPAQPGHRWVYGYNTDILGAVIEVASGQPLDVFLRERILEPLDMRDTHFYLPPAKADRLAAVYNLRMEGDRAELARAPAGPGMQAQGQYVKGPRKSFSGGAGLLSTARDYARFLQMLLNGGELEGERLLSPKSVELMTTNHVGTRYVDIAGPGMGFGLGFRIVDDLGAAGSIGSTGSFGWGGAYHSTYWVDPVERLVVVYFTQVIPAPGLDDHARLQALVYGALTEANAPVRTGGS